MLNQADIWIEMLGMRWYFGFMGRITSDPHILGGKPIIRGTRISVEFILSLVSSGMTIKDIVKDYPHLKEEDVKSAIEE